MRENGPRVLMTVDPIGGVWTYALALAQGLTRHGGKVALAAMGGPVSDAQRQAVDALPGVELFAGDFRLEWMDEPWADVDAAGTWLLELAAAWQPDLVHLNGYSHAVLPWGVPVIVVAHSCVATWWAAVRGEPLPDRFREYTRRVRAGLRAASHVVAPSAAMLRALQEQHGALAAASVIPNGLAADIVAAAKEPFILGVGRCWDEAKNIGLLAAIAPHLAWPVRVAGAMRDPAGAGRDWPALQALGPLSPAKLKLNYARASIFALPARYEPFGLSALEAAQHGCALVLADIASLREIWDGAAVFASPGDAAAWQGALAQLIATPAGRIELAMAAQRRAHHFTLERMTGGYLGLYETLRSRRAYELAAVPVP